MAITVNDDYTTIENCDTLGTNFNTGTGVNNPNTADGSIFVEGSASWRARVTGASLGGVGSDFGVSSSLVGGDHIMIWCKTLDAVSVADGWRIRYASGTDTNSNYREISAGGLDTSRNVVKGFFNFCVDPLFPAMNINGTPAILSNARSFAILANHTSSSSRDTFFTDEIKHGTGITVIGGAAAPRGSTEISDADQTAGRGTFVNINGVYFVLGRVTIGDVTAATNSTYEDSNKVWVFQNGSFAPDFHKIVFVGGTGTNSATFGSKVGTGITAVGAGGNSFLAAGLVPFHIMALDSAIDVNMYGCNVLGVSTPYTGPFRACIIDDAGLTDETFDAGNATVNDVSLLPATQVVNNAVYFGSGNQFSVISLNIGTASSGTYTIIWEYWNGAWVALDEVTDGTNAFTTSGTNEVTFETPYDWTNTTVNSQGPFKYIRARVTAVTTSGTAPLLTQALVSSGCHAHFEHANCDILSTTFTGMDQIHIHNNAIFRKNSIISSVTTIKDGAIDLGNVVPATDTFRDISVQNCNAGIHLRAATTWTFPNIQFAGNTIDVIQSAKATETDSYVESNQNATTSLNDTVHGVMQSVSGDGGTLSRARFYLNKTLTPTGTAVAKLYTHSGSFGTTSIPTGVALATSETVDVSTLTGTLTLTDFEFRDEFITASATNYVLTLEYTAGTAANTVNVGTDTTTPGHAGNSGTANTSFTWSAVAGTDTIFYLMTGGIATINITENGDTPVVNTLYGATIVNNTVPVKITILDSNNVPIHNARVLLEAASGGPLSVGTDILTGLTDSSGLIQDLGFSFVSNQPIQGWVRKSSSAPFYKTTNLTGSIVSTGYDVTLIMPFDQ